MVQPRDDRWHRRPTPLLGGAGIALATLVALAVFGPDDRSILVIAICAALAFALGLLDDFRHLAPTTKLVGQVLVASTLAFGGVHAEIVSFAPLAFVMTVFWVIAIMNALNLLDNMDGLAGGVAAIAAIVLGLTALPENPAAAAVAAVAAGAAMGFVVHNFSPARVFMGDAGSLFLGFLLAATALLHTASGAANLGLAVLGPIAVLALPIFDTALVTATRRAAGVPVSQGGRDHASHRLAALGLSDRAAVLVLYSIAAALALIGVLADRISTLVAPVFALAVVGLIVFGFFLAEVDVYGKRPQGAARSPVLRALVVYGRFGLEVGLDVVMLTTAYYLAYVIRFEGQPQSDWIKLFVASLPIVVGMQLAGLVALGVHRTLWRYLGVEDSIAMVRAVVFGTAAGILGILLAFRFEEYSRAVFVLDALLAAAFLGGSRLFLLWLRHWFPGRPGHAERRVLIVGANDTGALALRLLGKAADARYRAVGFLDDDPGKRYRRVAGVPIAGGLDHLAVALERLRVDLVVVALDPDDQAAIDIRRTCEARGIECRDLFVPA